MKIKDEHKDKELTIYGAFVNETKKLGDLTKDEIRMYVRRGMIQEDYIEQPKPRKKYKGINEEGNKEETPTDS